MPLKEISFIILNKKNILNENYLEQSNWGQIGQCPKHLTWSVIQNLYTFNSAEYWPTYRFITKIGPFVLHICMHIRACVLCISVCYAEYCDHRFVIHTHADQ